MRRPQNSDEYIPAASHTPRGGSVARTQQDAVADELVRKHFSGGSQRSVARLG
jgi:hypothetical protein